MKKIRLLILCLVILASCTQPKNDLSRNYQEILINPEMSQTIKTAYQGSIDLSAEELVWLAKNNEIVVTRYINKEKIEYLKSHNPDLKVLQYVNIKLVHKNYVLDKPYYEAVDEANLFWRTEQDEKILHNTYKSYLVDISNPMWFEIVSKILSQNDIYGNSNYDGVMFDDTSLLWEESYTGLPAEYIQASELTAFSEILSKHKLEYPEKTILFNGYKYNLEDNLKGIKLLESAEIISFETFLYNFNGSSYGQDRIEVHIEDFAYITDQLNKSAVFVEIGKSTDYEKRLLCFATYMLLENDNSIYGYISTDNPDNIQPFPEYYMDIGEPIGLYIKSNNLYRRLFTKGEVIVNFGNSNEEYMTTKSVRILNLQGGGSLQNMGTLQWYETEGNLEIKPMSAIILKYN